MKGKLLSLYDNFYYDFAVAYDYARKRRYLRRELRHYDPGPAFDKAFKEVYIPYWAQFGVKPFRPMAVVNYIYSGELDPRYIPNDIWGQYIVPYFNDKRFSGLLADKNLNQHPILSAMNSSSVNTLRPITLVFKGEPMILSVVLRVGAPGSVVDNMCSGGYQIAVLPDGKLSSHAYTNRNGKDDLVDISDQPVFCQTVPGYAAACAAALKGARQLPHLRLVAWDFAIDEQGEPVLLELNTHAPGQNQETNGPTFGDRTEEILSEVFAKRRKKK